MTTQEQMDRYDEKYKDMAFTEIEKNILAMSDQDPDKEPFYEIFIDTLTLNGMNGLLIVKTVPNEGEGATELYEVERYEGAKGAVIYFRVKSEEDRDRAVICNSDGSDNR